MTTTDPRTELAAIDPLSTLEMARDHLAMWMDCQIEELESIAITADEFLEMVRDEIADTMHDGITDSSMALSLASMFTIVESANEVRANFALIRKAAMWERNSWYSTDIPGSDR